MPSGITTPREPVLRTLMAGTDPEGKKGAFRVFPTSKKHDFRLETPLPQQYTLAPSTTHSKSPAPDGSPARSLKPASGQSSASRQKSPQTRNQPVIEKQLFTSLDGSLSKNPYPVIAVDHHHCKERRGVKASVRTTRDGSLVRSPEPLPTPCGDSPPPRSTYLLHSSWDLLSDLQNESCYPCGLHPPQNLKRKK